MSGLLASSQSRLGLASELLLAVGMLPSVVSCSSSGEDELAPYASQGHKIRGRAIFVTDIQHFLQKYFKPIRVVDLALEPDMTNRRAYDSSSMPFEYI